jgi:hypothetical protein
MRRDIRSSKATILRKVGAGATSTKCSSILTGPHPKSVRSHAIIDAGLKVGRDAKVGSVVARRRAPLGRCGHHGTAMYPCSVPPAKSGWCLRLFICSPNFSRTSIRVPAAARNGRFSGTFEATLAEEHLKANCHAEAGSDARPSSIVARHPYRVLDSASDGILNLRNGPGSGHSVVVAMPLGGADLSVGQCRMPDDGGKIPWCEVEWRGKTG